MPPTLFREIPANQKTLISDIHTPSLKSFLHISLTVAILSLNFKSLNIIRMPMGSDPTLHVKTFPVYSES